MLLENTQGLAILILNLTTLLSDSYLRNSSRINIWSVLSIFCTGLVYVCLCRKENEALVDVELREHRHAITNAFTQEELAGPRKKVQEQ